MVIGIYARELSYLPEYEAKDLMNTARQWDVDLRFDSCYAKESKICEDYKILDSRPNEVDYVMSFGGDGTFLQCVKLLGECEVPIIGINRGNLGFLLSGRSGSCEVFKAIVGGEFEIEKRDMIAIEGVFDRGVVSLNAFNEFTLQKKGFNMINVAMEIDGSEVTTYRADGLIVSTPSGSTAYSMSVGGPVVSPDCNCFIITPIAPHNLTMRPLVINNNSKIKLRVDCRKGESFATADNECFSVKSGSEFNLSLSRTRVKILKLKDCSYYETLTKKLMWGKTSD